MNSLQQPPPPQPFGLILPGKPVITEFVPDISGNKYTLDLPFPFNANSSFSMDDDDSIPISTSTPTSSSSQTQLLPTSISDLVFFLLPNTPLPPNNGAMLYWSAAPMNTFDNPLSSTTIGPGTFELLGSLTPDKTSAVFRTGWNSHDQLLSLIQETLKESSSYKGIMITIGISIEPLDNISNLDLESKGVGDRKSIAKKIATDLFNYLQSFDDVGNARSGWMTVPVNVFERWFKRFEGKIDRDPNFFMKNSIE
eukprot:scaffold4020_cov234-Chaetoceros_neogracile.AAC.8